MNTERIGKIDHADIGNEDHGIPTVFVELDYGGGSRQSIPLYNLSVPGGWDFVQRLMWAAGVERWSAMKGRTILAIIDDDNMICGLKPLPTEPGLELNIAEFWKRMGCIG